MKDLTSLELKCLMHELGFLKGARIEKIYHNVNELRIKFHAPARGTFTLLAAPGRLYLTKKEREPEKPTGFAMLLRKYLSGKKIDSVAQHGFDRIAEITTENNALVIELFHKGNFILCDKDYNIIMPMTSRKWKDREIKAKKPYAFPQPVPLNFGNAIAFPECQRAMLSEHTGGSQLIEGALHMYGFGSYAKEVLALAGVENKKCSELDKDEIKKIEAAMAALLERKPEPEVVFENGAPVDAVLFSTSAHAGKASRQFSTFSEALDFYYGATERKTERKDIIAENMHRALKKMEREEKALEKEIALINRNYGKAEASLQERRHLLEIEGTAIRLDISKTLQQNLNVMYNKVKKLRLKQKRAAQHAGSFSEKAARHDRPHEARQWYHKYRHFIASDGTIVVAGKDERTNEELIKKHTAPKDIVLHADITGAPFVVIKHEKDISEDAIKEAATFAACFSKAWPKGLGSVDVYWVKHEQVSKSAPSGEHIGKGAFMIRGRKNYIRNVEMKICTGITESGAVLTAPEPAIKKQTRYYAAVMPGMDKDIGKKIKRRLETIVPASMKEKAKALKPGEITARLPSGRGMLA